MTYFYCKEGPSLYALQYLRQIVKDIPKMAGDCEDSCGRIPRKAKEFFKASCTHGDLNSSTHYGPINIHNRTNTTFSKWPIYLGPRHNGEFGHKEIIAKEKLQQIPGFWRRTTKVAHTPQLYSSIRKTSQQTFSAPDIKL